MARSSEISSFVGCPGPSGAAKNGFSDERPSAPAGGPSAPAGGQIGSSGSTAIAMNSSVRYVIDAWNTRIGLMASPRTARL